MIRFPDKANAGLPCHRGPILFSSPGKAIYWNPEDMFTLGQHGHWAGGYSPDAFSPSQLIPLGAPGYWAGGYEPPEFDPELLFPDGVVGFWAGGYAEDTSPPVVPPAPGPLDFIENRSGLTSMTVQYDLARPVALLGVGFRHSGALTGMTASHGGEALALVGFQLNPDTNLGVAVFEGDGLTIEPAALVVTPVGGTIGPAVGRIDDSFALNDVAVGVSGGRYGYSNGHGGATPVVFDPVAGNGYGLWALACSSAEQQGTVISWGAGSVDPLFWGVASSGSLVDAPAFTAGIGWTKTGDWWTHAGDASYLNGGALPAGVVNPFWWEVEVDVADGDRLYIQTVGGAGYLNELIMGPFTGVIRRYRDQTYTATSFRMQALGVARFRNMRYCADGETVYAQFGRTVDTVPNGSSLQFKMGSLSRFAGVIVEVHEG